VLGSELGGLFGDRPRLRLMRSRGGELELLAILREEKYDYYHCSELVQSTAFDGSFWVVDLDHV
jgi:hypothetical protein